MEPFRRLEINGGRVEEKSTVHLQLPPIVTGYADAQIDDYGAVVRRRHYPHQPGTTLSLRARFSHTAEQLIGTAGFGFWNAPFGDPTVPWPTLPQATWFFFGSPPNDLPLAPNGAGRPLEGRGWFASTLDATRPRALAMAPFTPIVLLLNNLPAIRRLLWPRVQRNLQISFAPLTVNMTQWHSYQLDWQPDGCTFFVDDVRILQTPHSPRGPLGFVCWIDNQYMVATANGRFRFGTLPTATEQWLEIDQLSIQSSNTA